MSSLAVIGITSLYILFGWLACCMATSYLSDRKGYPQRVGLAAGMFLTIFGVLLMLVLPAREGSDWKVIGPFGRSKPGPEGERPVS